MSKRTHNNILITITIIAIILAFLAAMSLDSGTWIPTVILGVCVGWLALFCIANLPKVEKGEKSENEFEDIAA